MPAASRNFTRLFLTGVVVAIAVGSVTPPALAAWTIFGKRDDAPPAAPVQPVQAVDPNRLNNLENQVRQLTGQVEELTHQLQVLQDQLQRFQQDAEFRFGELEHPGQGGKTAAATPAPAATPQPSAPPAAAASTALPPAQPQQLGAPEKPLGTVVITSPGSGAQPLDLSSLASQPDAGGPPPGDTAEPPGAVGSQPAPAQVASTGDPRGDYDAAYAAFTANQYDVAEQSFRQFLATYPQDEQAPEARYWLGLSLFVRGDYQHAAEEFLNSYKAFPQGKRAPDALLQLGLSQAGLGHPEESCKTYALALKQYPQMSNALKQRIVNARATAGC